MIIRGSNSGDEEMNAGKMQNQEKIDDAQPDEEDDFPETEDMELPPVDYSGFSKQELVDTLAL